MSALPACRATARSSRRERRGGEGRRRRRKKGRECLTEGIQCEGQREILPPGSTRQLFFFFFFSPGAKQVELGGRG